jgi:hypothetical protein
MVKMAVYPRAFFFYCSIYFFITVILKRVVYSELLSAVSNDGLISDMNPVSDNEGFISETLAEMDVIKRNLGANKQSENNDVSSLSATELSLESCNNENDELLARLRRLENVFNVTQSNADLADASLLELMYSKIQKKIFSSIPDTDEACHFNLITGKCTNSCYCEFRPVLGDYTPSRMCRLIVPDKLNTSCDALQKDPAWIIESAKIVKKIITTVVVSSAKRIKERAPPSDSDCNFSLKSMECSPNDQCVFSFHFGDYSLSRSCRYKVEDE